MMYILLLISIGAIWFSGFLIGRTHMMRIYAQIMADDPDSMIAHLHRIKEIKEVQDQEQIEVIIEQHKDNFFVYNKQTKLFLGQGSTIDNAMQTVAERFPDQVFCHEETN